MSVDSRFAAPALASLKDCALDDPRLPTPLFVIDSQKLEKNLPADRIVIPACCCRGSYRCPFKIYIRINPIDTSRIQCIQRITLINPFLPYVFSNCCQLLLFSFGKILSYNRSMIDAASSAYRRQLFELQPTRIYFLVNGLSLSGMAGQLPNQIASRLIGCHGIQRSNNP